MAIGNYYPISPTVVDQDLFLGTKLGGNNTVNYTAQTVSEYLSTKITIGGQLSFIFDTTPGVQKTISFSGGGGNNTPFSSITQLIVSSIDALGANVVMYLNYLVGSEILLSESTEPNIFGHYKITSYTITANPAFYTLNLQFIGGNGAVTDGLYYNLSPFALSSGGNVPTKTSDLINDGDDGINPFISALALSPYLLSTTAASTYYPIPTGTTSQYIRGDGSLATFPTSSVPTLNQVLTAGNVSLLDAKIGVLYGYDNNNADYGTLEFYDSGVVMKAATTNKILFYNDGLGSVSFSNGAYSPILNFAGVGNNLYTFQNANGTLAFLSDIPSLTGYVPTSRTLTINGTTYDLTANRSWSVGTVTSVGLSMPSAFTVSSSPVTGSGTIAVTGAGTVSQYVRGDGTLANFPNSTGGGASVNYYLNGSISQGTFGGDTYYQMSKTPILGAGTNFTRTNGAGNGYIASFITDAGDPSFLNIPGGNWNLELYFQSSASGGSPQFYGEIYKVSATNVFTLVASGSANPEGITNGTTVDQYFTSVPVPQTSLLITDRLAIRIYVITGGRTITLHTENGNLCEVLTTFTTGLTALNGLTSQVQYFAVGTSGTDFNISSATDTHTFNLPDASATARGVITTGTQTIAGAKTFSTGIIASYTSANTIASISGTGQLTGLNTSGGYPDLTELTYVKGVTSAIQTQLNAKQNSITLTTTGTSGPATLVGSTLNIPQYSGGGGGNILATHVLAKPLSGFYYGTGIVANLNVTNTTNGTLILSAFTPAYNLTVSELVMQVTTLLVGGLIKTLIYSDLNGVPNTKLFESATAPTDTTGLKTITGFSFTFNAGTTYWISIIANGTVGVRSLNPGATNIAPLIAVSSSTQFYQSWFMSTPFASPATTLTTPTAGNLNGGQIPYVVFRAT